MSVCWCNWHKMPDHLFNGGQQRMVVKPYPIPIVAQLLCPGQSRGAAMPIRRLLERVSDP
jgi:hypothetical protein